VAAEKEASRFGEEVIRFRDPDGLLLELIASDSSNAAQPWAHNSVPTEHSIRGFHSVSSALEGYERTAKLLTESFGYRFVDQSGNRFRFSAQSDSGSGRTIDLLGMPESQPGHVAAGTVHHIAFRTQDDEEQRQWREHLIELGYNVSPVMDRTYFHSIYFREPGGVLFEIATDPPGFTVDEKLEKLGTDLCLPPWLELSRPEIEQILPRIELPR
jgi:glyoxalase family protein